MLHEMQKMKITVILEALGIQLVWGELPVQSMCICGTCLDAFLVQPQVDFAKEMAV
jgi:hypothetical protein